MSILVLTFVVVGVAAGLVAPGSGRGGRPTALPIVWTAVRAGLDRQLRLWDRYLGALYPWDDGQRR